jgi:hypothetical protein
MKLDFSRQSIEKYWNVKFHENPSSGRRVVPSEQADKHNEANSRFSQFCKGVYKHTNLDAYFIPLVHATLALLSLVFPAHTSPFCWQGVIMVFVWLSAWRMITSLTAFIDQSLERRRDPIGGGGGYILMRSPCSDRVGGWGWWWGVKC